MGINDSQIKVLHVEMLEARKGGMITVLINKAGEPKLSIVSNCCSKSIYAVHCEDGPGYYVCRQCDIPCQPLMINGFEGGTDGRIDKADGKDSDNQT